MSLPDTAKRVLQRELDIAKHDLEDAIRARGAAEAEAVRHDSNVERLRAVVSELDDALNGRVD